MNLALTVVCVGASLLGGGLAGYRLGTYVRGRLGTYWILNLVALVGCAMLDFAGMATGHYVLGYSALGLMGGLITGMKYGYTDSLRIWPDPEPAETPADAAETPAIDSATGHDVESVESSG